MQEATMKVTQRGGKKETEFSYQKPETPEELLALTGVQDAFQFVVEEYEKRLKKRMAVVLFDHTQKVGGKQKKVKGLSDPNEIAKVVARVKLVRKKKNSKLSPAELREQIRSQLIAAGRSQEQVDEFMAEYDENVAVANSAEVE